MSVHRASGMHVEETHLADNRRADEAPWRGSVHLWANFQATAAGNTCRKLVRLFLRLGCHARTFAKIISAVDRNPCFDSLQTFKHELPVDSQLTHYRKFRKRLDANKLFHLIDQRRTLHP